MKKKNKQKCRACGKEMKPDYQARNFNRDNWDGHTYHPCKCANLPKNTSLRISIG